jgi:hypothetical protein
MLMLPSLAHLGTPNGIIEPSAKPFPNLGDMLTTSSMELLSESFIANTTPQLPYFHNVNTKATQWACPKSGLIINLVKIQEQALGKTLSREIAPKEIQVSETTTIKPAASFTALDPSQIREKGTSYISRQFSSTDILHDLNYEIDGYALQNRVGAETVCIYVSDTLLHLKVLRLKDLS